jgi:ADP-ribosylglycohydrolase
MKTKEIFFATLMNHSGDNSEEYRLMNVSIDILNNGKDEDVKELIRERIDDFFNNDIESYFDKDNLSEEVEKCINDLASGKEGSIQGEYFWWGYTEGLVVMDD